MKKTLLTLALVAACTAAFGQGKVSFANDSAHLFVIGTAAQGDVGGGTISTAANTASGAPGAIPVSPLPSGRTLYAALFAAPGAVTDGLTLKTSYALTAANWGPTPGKMVARSLTLAGVPGGAIASLAVVVSDVDLAVGAAFPGGVNNGQAPAGWAGLYYGTSGIFNMTPGASIAYPFIYNGGGTTWAPGNLVINAIPEPASFALLGLGAAAMLIFRRRS